MKTIKMTMIALLAVISLGSCKKDEEKTTAQKILGRWAFLTQVTVNTPAGGASTPHTDKGAPADYIEFKSDGSAVFSIESDGGDPMSAKYTIDNDNQISIIGLEDPDDIIPYQIKTLNSNSLILYTTFSYSDGKVEVTTTLGR